MPATCPRCDGPLTGEICPACGTPGGTAFFRPETPALVSGELATLAGADYPLPRELDPALGIPGYAIEAELGRGGMGVVYRARQVGLGREVALKVLKPELRGDDAARARFRREAESMARLNHPGIVHVHEVGEHAGVPFFSMELVTGGALSERLRGGPLDFATAAALVEQLARAVFAAHEQGVIHRDLKPANVLLRMADCGLQIADCRLQIEEAPPQPAFQSAIPNLQSAIPNLQSAIPKVSDFGLARRLGADTGDTQAGAVLGTPSYMAPEQARGEEGGRQVGKRADVYALGAVLYECLTGRPPFLGSTVLDTLEQVLHAEPVPPSRLRPGCPRDLETICLRCLHKQPERRYVSALSLANDLAHYRAGEPIVARPAGLGERAVKWARRRPGVTALLTALALCLAGVVGGAVYLAHVSEANYRRELGLRLKLEAASKAEEEQRGAAGRAREQLRDAEGRLAASLGRLKEARGQLEGVTAGVEEARGELDRLRGQAEQSEYVKHLFLANVAAGRAEVGRANGLLDACPKDRRHWEWGYLKKRCRPDEAKVVSLLPVLSLAASPDGKLMALCVGNPGQAGASGQVLLLDAATLAVERRLEGIAGAAMAARFSPDGKRMVTFGATFDMVRVTNATAETELAHLFRAEAKLWDLTTDKALEPAWGGVTGAAWSPDGKRRATAWKDGQVTVRDLPSEDVHFRTLRQPGMVTNLTFSGDGRWLAGSWQQLRVPGPDEERQAGAGMFRFGLTVWDARTGKLALEVADASYYAFRPDGKELAVGTVGGQVELYDPAARAVVGRLLGHVSAVTAVTYSRDGARLATADTSREVRVWDVGGRRARAVLLGCPQVVTSLLFGPEGTRLFAASGDGVLRSWDVRGGAERHFDGAAQPSGSPVFSPDGGRMFVPGQTRVRGYDLRTGEELPLPRGLGWSVAVAAKAGTFAAAANREVRVYASSAFTAKGPPPLLGQFPAEEKVLSLVLGPSGRRLFASSFTERGGGVGAMKLEAIDLTTKKPLWSGGGADAPVATLALSPDGKQLAAVQLNGALRVLDAATGKLLREVEPGGAAALFISLAAVAYSPDGKYLAAATNTALAGGQKTAVRIYEAATGKLHAELPGHEGAVCGLSYTPDGRRLAVASMDLGRLAAGEVRLWDTAARAEVMSLEGARGVAFSPDGRRLAAVGIVDISRAVVRLWEADEW